MNDIETWSQAWKIFRNEAKDERLLWRNETMYELSKLLYEAKQDRHWEIIRSMSDIEMWSQACMTMSHEEKQEWYLETKQCGMMLRQVAKHEW